MRALPGEQRERGRRDGRPGGSAEGDALEGAGVVLVVVVVGAGAMAAGLASRGRSLSLAQRLRGCGEERAFTSLGGSAWARAASGGRAVMGEVCGGSRGRGARHKGCSHTCPSKRQKSVVVARRRAAKVEMTLAESVVRSRACAVHLVVIRFRGTPATVSLSRLAPPSSQARTTGWAGQSLSLRLYRHSPRGGTQSSAALSIHPRPIRESIHLHMNIIPAPAPS